MKTTLFKSLFTICLAILFESPSHAGDSRFINIWVNPFAMGASLNDAGIDFRISTHLALGLESTSMYLNPTGISSFSATAMGLNFRYYINEAISSGLRFSVGYAYMTYEAFQAPFLQLPYYGKSNANVFALEFGYHWVPTIINFFFGLGVGYYTTPSTFTLSNGVSTVQVSIPTTGVASGASITAGIDF